MMASAIQQLAMTKLTNVMGDVRAVTVMQDILSRAKLEEVRTPQDLLLVAEHMIASGGLLEVVGRALKVQAVLRGASEKVKDVS
jgi:hypothetical protein